ncbi:MAG: transglutaminase family protein, partial [Povalibacter sp.]
MSIHVALNHVTHYKYDRRVSLGPQVVRLRPAPHSRTRVLSYSLRVTPTDHFINWQQDPQSNYLARLVFEEKTTEFKVEVDLVAEMAVFNPFDFFLEEYAQNFPFKYQAEEQHELAPYLIAAPLTPLFSEYLEAIPRQRMRTIDFLVLLNQRLAADVKYLIRLEPGVQTPEQTLQKASGSCRDSSWLLAQLLRHCGLATRFVSGYLIQLVADVKSLDGPSGPPADFTDLHAWCEVYLPGAGWIGLDPTSGLLAGEGHIPLACTPEPSSAAPISGAVDESEVEFSHSMKVERIWEAPRVTKPYTDAEWSEIERLGAQVDRDLLAQDVRLTMGGEPTFISIDDPDGAEWNTAALGPKKRPLAAQLFHKLKAKYAPLGLAHFGQGKWYPGEQLPRWSLNCFWRRDGEPVWADPALYADESVNYGADEVKAQRFLGAVAQRLGVSSRHLFAAYEDVFYYLWRERQLPSNVDPLDSKLEDPLERARLAKIFSRGLDRVIGHVLPIARHPSGAAWQSGPWFLRAERCYLIPGDSPIGYRLPRDSQPWVKAGDYPYLYPQDPTVRQPPLARHAEIRRQLIGLSNEDAAASHKTPSSAAGAADRWHDSWPRGDESIRRPANGESADGVTRTAMCAESRNGVLYVFMPPTVRLEEYLELVSAVESVAQSQSLPVVLEGYEPPRDPRLNYFRITPDPG